MFPVLAWVCTAVMLYACTLTHGPILALTIACTAVVVVWAVWVTHHR